MGDSTVGDRFLLPCALLWPPQRRVHQAPGTRRKHRQPPVPTCVPPSAREVFSMRTVRSTKQLQTTTQRRPLEPAKLGFGLLNRYRGSTSIVSSNLIPSANQRT